MSKRLYLTGQQAIVSHTTGIGKGTTILFSIDDRKRIAWYVFSETSARFNREQDEDLEDGKTGSWSVFGQPTKSDLFHPRNDLDVDQFGTSDHPGMRALLSSEFVKNTVYIGLTVFLTSGPENLLLGFSSTQPAFHVRHHEQGYVGLVKVEKYSASVATSPSRIRDFSRFPMYKH